MMAHDPAPEWKIQPAGRKDSELVDGLLEGTGVQHRHLDWSRPHDLLEKQPFYLATERGLPVGCLACPPDPKEVCWVRLFAVASPYDPKDVWLALWEPAARDAARRGVERAAVLCLPDWLAGILESSRFVEQDQVIFFEWETGPVDDLPSDPEGVEPIRSQDLPGVTRVDNRAFRLIWRHSEDTLRVALDQSAHATLIRIDGQIVAYQISTASAFGGHLARLAVLPEYQGQGLAAALVAGVLRHFRERGYPRVTVNTQQSNRRSIDLYLGLGFHSMDRSYPVYEKSL